MRKETDPSSSEIETECSAVEDRSHHFLCFLQNLLTAHAFFLAYPDEIPHSSAKKSSHQIAVSPDGIIFRIILFLHAFHLFRGPTDFVLEDIIQKLVLIASRRSMIDSTGNCLIQISETLKLHSDHSGKDARMRSRILAQAIESSRDI